MFHADKAILRGNFIILSVCYKKKKKSQINDLSIYHKTKKMKENETQHR